MISGHAPKITRTLLKTLFGSFLVYHTYRTYDSYKFKRKEISQVPLSVFLFKLLPLKFSSGITSSIAQAELPVWSRTWILYLYSKFTGVNLSEAENTDLKQYSTINKFFSRKLVNNAREIHPNADLVSPCDGTILEIGKFNESSKETNQIISKVKGFQFSVDQLLYGIGMKDTKDTTSRILRPLSKQNSLYYCVMYLAPGDYHRFHSPVASWSVHTVNHIHGELLPVAPKIVSLLKTVFTLNERCSMLGTWKHGHFNMIPVGSTNVGSIKLNDFTITRYLSSMFKESTHTEEHALRTKEKNSLESTLSYLKNLILVQEKTHMKELSTSCVHGLPSNPVIYSMGQEVGYFELGSTVILIFEAPDHFRFSVYDGQKIQMGNELGKLDL